jgi:hypothetical protein
VIVRDNRVTTGGTDDGAAGEGRPAGGRGPDADLRVAMPVDVRLRQGKRRLHG